MAGLKNTLKKNTMFFALVVVMILFQVMISVSDKGSLFNPANISNIISQNAYVVILASGMLLCILTGGNIDLSVGSIVCLVGAVAGTLIVNMNVNIYFAMALSLLVGLAIGAWHGFWIAYVRIPPFIVTLAGMLLWRGVAMIILNGLTISPFPAEYLKYFTSFLPGEAEGPVIYAVTLSVAFAACALYVVLQVLDRIKKIRKGYETEPLAMMITRLAVICAAVLLVFWFLAQHKGIPVVLILITIIVLIYS
jgi:putative multiple sugar transport system permease protein